MLSGFFVFSRSSMAQKVMMLGVLGQVLTPLQQVAAHGALGFPLARQYGCEIDGGYWWPDDGSGIKNAGCRAAYKAGPSGNAWYPFTQWNEFSANPSNPDSMASVQAAVPDGLLCAGGDANKKGIDVPQDSGWNKTVITPSSGSFGLRWELTASHNPSTMHIYISKTSYDPSKALTWDDLDLLLTRTTPNPIPANGTGLVGSVTSFYKFDVPLNGRTGDAIIFAYWQRQDAGHEGFFNCADVTIKSGSSTTAKTAAKSVSSKKTKSKAKNAAKKAKKTKSKSKNN
ncbi:chitin binding domain-containing protein [Gongronella butleri]|nr:chitin binding domain-containing protein [Gongronella butleri]